VDRLEHAGRYERIEYWRLGVVLDFDVCTEEALAVFVRQEQNRLVDRANVALDEERLVLLDEIAGVATRYVAKIHRCESGRIEVQPNRIQPSPGNSGGDRPPRT